MEYDEALERLNRLLDEVGTDEHHSLYGFLDVLGTLIHAYEEEHIPIPECSGHEMFQFFMEEHDLTPSDLPEIGSPQIVSNILNGKQELTIHQIKSLARRFRISPAVFV
jgi:HTH-type transcriptional regulator/antitoxin HigA